MEDDTELIYYNCPICFKCGTSGFCEDQTTFFEHIKNHPWQVGNHNIEDCINCQNVLDILKIVIEKISRNDNRIKQKLAPREYLFLIPLHNEIIYFSIPPKRGHYF